MSFLKYSNETQSNIIPQDQFQLLVQEVFRVVSDGISKSLGPLGSYATILEFSNTAATKDGYSILKKYNFHNKYKRLLFDLIKSPCDKMNSTVGDGTTTAITLTQKMYDYYVENKNIIESTYMLPRKFNIVLDDIVNKMTELIKSESRQIDDVSIIRHIAYVTSNGDKEVSDAIASVYADDPSPIIKQKESSTTKTYIEKVDGFHFPCNLIDESFVKSEDLSAEEDNLSVMIFDYKIDNEIFVNIIAQINDVLRSHDKKLLVIAPAYDALLCKTVLEQYLISEHMRSGKSNLILAQYDPGKLGAHYLYDLELIVNTIVITQQNVTELSSKLLDTSVDALLDDIDNKPFPYIGQVEHASMSCLNGSIFKSEYILELDRYKDTVKTAERYLEETKAFVTNSASEYSTKIYDAQNRVNRLKMKSYIYYIGENSQLEKQIKWDSIEDVIKCTKSASKYGTVPGCQLTILKSISTLTDIITKDKSIKQEDLKLYHEIILMIDYAVRSVYAKVLTGPNGNGHIKMVDDWVNLAKTDEGATKVAERANELLLDILTTSVMNGKVYDLESREYSSDIITSAETDIMVLQSASELLKILISGTQCVFVDHTIDGTHSEQIMM